MEHLHTVITIDGSLAEVEGEMIRYNQTEKKRIHIDTRFFFLKNQFRSK